MTALTVNTDPPYAWEEGPDWGRTDPLILEALHWLITRELYKFDPETTPTGMDIQKRLKERLDGS